MNSLYTATATAELGRSGHVSTEDKAIDTKLSVPKELGGEGGPHTNPEQLFSAGYAACFGSALQHVAKEKNIDLEDYSVTVNTTLGKTDEDEYQLEVIIDAYLPKVDVETGEDLINTAHEVCPYSRATRDNIDVTLNLLLDE